MRDGYRFGRAVAMLGRNHVRVAAPRIISLERFRSVQPHVDPAAGARHPPVTRVPLRSPQRSIETPGQWNHLTVDRFREIGTW
jgi:hypothetical protein